MPTLVAADVFRFLNVERRCSLAADWQPGGADKLWIYNLHYFDDLNAHAAANRRHWHHQLLERWVAENPPGQGEGWEPYPLSRRIVNWVKWGLRGNAFPAACRTSLAVQARWLLGRLEYHLLGNHLLANASALVHAGLYFAGPEAERWYGRGMHILGRELPAQVLPDGGHFERSTMYHASTLEHLLDTGITAGGERRHIRSSGSPRRARGVGPRPERPREAALPRLHQLSAAPGISGPENASRFRRRAP